MYMITGASGGLGKAFCFACAKRGIDLFLTDRDADKLEKLKTCLNKLYDIRVETYVCDLSSEEERDRFYNYIQNGGYAFTGLLNIAGGDVEGAFDERDLKEMRANMQVNMLSVVENMRMILSHREDPNEPFTIINVSSLAAFQPMPYKALYAASKRFMLQLSLALREELKDRSVSITTLCPAGMPTNKESVEGIRVQGFAGRITTRNVGDVAELTLKKALRKRAIVIPGGINRFVKTVSSAVSPIWVSRIVKKRWQPDSDSSVVYIGEET